MDSHPTPRVPTIPPTDSTSAIQTPEPLVKLFGFRTITDVLNRDFCSQLLAAQGDTNDPLPRPIYHHPQIACGTCAAIVQQPGIGHTCLFAALDIVEAGVIRLPRCLRHLIAGERCDVEGTQLSLVPKPRSEEWDDWARNGTDACVQSWTGHVELRGLGGETRRLEMEPGAGERGIKRKWSRSPVKRPTLDPVDNGAGGRETYGVDAESSIFARGRLQPSSSYRPTSSTARQPLAPFSREDDRDGFPAAGAMTSTFHMRPTQSFRPAERHTLVPAASTLADQHAQAEAVAELESQRQRVRDAEVRVHQMEANLREAQAHARRAENELVERTEERDRAIEGKKYGLEQMVGRLRDAEARTDALRTEKQALGAEIDKLKKDHVDEAGREKAKSTKLRKQAAEEAMRANDLEKQLKIAKDSDGPMKEMTATVLRVDNNAKELEREKVELVGALSEAARQRDLAIVDASTAKAHYEGTAKDLQDVRNMASRLEITRQRQAEEIELLRAAARDQSAKHDGFVARTTADRATFFSEKKKLVDKVAGLEAELAGTKDAAQKGRSAEVVRLEAELEQVRGEVKLAHEAASSARDELGTQTVALSEAAQKVADEQAKSARAWATVQKMIAENGRSASEREIRVSQGKKDAEAAVRAKEKELEVARRELSKERALVGTLEREQEQLRSEFEAQLGEERGKTNTLGQKLASLEQSSNAEASARDAEQKLKAVSAKVKRVQGERDTAIEEATRLRAELEDLRTRLKASGGASAEHLPTPRSAAAEDETSMRDEHDTAMSGCGESTIADSTLLGELDPSYTDGISVDAGSLDDAAPKTLSAQIKLRDREIIALRKRIDKAELLEMELVENRKMAGKWSRRVDKSLAIIKILQSKVEELEKERAEKWKKGRNPVYIEMTVPQELARARKMLRTMGNELRPKCACGVAVEEEEVNEVGAEDSAGDDAEDSAAEEMEHEEDGPEPAEAEREAIA